MGPEISQGLSADVQSVMEDPARCLVSKNLQVVLRREERSRSPVSVQEWVAALPEPQEKSDDREAEAEAEAAPDEDDNLTLGAEGE